MRACCRGTVNAPVAGSYARTDRVGMRETAESTAQVSGGTKKAVLTDRIEWNRIEVAVLARKRKSSWGADEFDVVDPVRADEPPLLSARFLPSLLRSLVAFDTECVR